MASMNDFVQYFDINSDIRPKVAKAKSVSGESKTIRAWPQWLTLLAGIIIQPYLESYKATGSWDFQIADFWGWLLFSVIVAFIIFPSIYKKAFDPEKPLAVLLAPIFTAGIGWEAIFGTVVKLAS